MAEMTDRNNTSSLSRPLEPGLALIVRKEFTTYIFPLQNLTAFVIDLERTHMLYIYTTNGTFSFTITSLQSADILPLAAILGDIVYGPLYEITRPGQ